MIPGVAAALGPGFRRAERQVAVGGDDLLSTVGVCMGV